jgi:hypothetical protein
MSMGTWSMLPVALVTLGMVSKARVGNEDDTENYLTYAGAFTGEGPITFSCSAGNGHPLTALSGMMTAVQVETLEVVPEAD